MQVAFGIPAYDNKVYLDTANSLSQARLLLDRAGVGSGHIACGGGVHVDGARDEIVAEFLQSDCTHLMFVDADIGFDPEDVLKLLEHDRDMVCGVYCHKHPEPRFTLRLRLSSGLARWDGELVLAEAVPSGMLLMKRESLERMTERYASLQYQVKGKDLTALHYMYLHNGGMIREDIAFGLRWSAIGEGIWVDTTIIPRHWDGRQSFNHSFAEYIAQTPHRRH